MTKFIYPTVKRVTSHFRKERKNHHGTDFAQSGYHEIKAVASGTVSRSYLSDSYGECVMVVHNIDGVVYESVYAHMRKGSRKVYVGQTVKQGQVIGVMGNTGDSTGQHLHFELHKGRWNLSKSNAVDPLKYLGSAVNDNSTKYTLVNDVDGFMDSQSAKNKKGVKTKVKKGQYYVYNQSNGMINVTKEKGVPGSWINPNDNDDGFKKGDTVKIKNIATLYQTGEVIPNWVKNNKYKIVQINGNYAVLSDINSKVYLYDLEK